MALLEYRRKRTFARTPEPTGRGRTPAAGRAFVVQAHDASSLHYDFRLELRGVLKSWAVPKGPSLNPADKRLAVRVEDHPVAYAGFEGRIPDGQYGAGAVIVWDRGRWVCDDPDPAGALRRGRLSFTLHGERLKGRWTLTRMGGDAGEDGRNWLLIKARDAHAKAADPADPAEAASVLSGRTLSQVRGGARDSGAGPGPRGSVATVAQKRRRRPDMSGVARIVGSKRASMPRHPRPQLCVLVEAPPGEAGWLHEVKYDGYRLLAHKSGDRVRLLTRTGLDWASRFGPLASAIGALRCTDALIDGEATVLDAEGKPSFQALQGAIGRAAFESLVYFAFDLLHLDGFDLRGATIERRKQALERLVGARADRVIRFSEHLRGDGPLALLSACRMGLEGIVSKRAGSAYAEGRTGAWLKAKCAARQEFVVVGYTPPRGTREGLGALVLGARDERGRLVHTGNVGAGLSDATLRILGARLRAIRRADAPLDVAPDRTQAHGVRWVEPRIVAEVAFSGWTAARRLRHPTFEGLREDKSAAEVRIEAPGAAGPKRAGARPRGRAGSPKRGSTRAARALPGGATSTSGRTEVVLGVTISHPDRVVSSDADLTKADLARYYALIARRMLPHIAGRPLSVVRRPAGAAGTWFFQKRLGPGMGSPGAASGAGEPDSIRADDAEDLVRLVQFGVIEVHAWGSLATAPDRPDLLTFDLDPAPGVPFDRVKAAAIRVRRILESHGLRAFLKVSGGKGLHVVAPLQPGGSWTEAKAFAKQVAVRMAAEEPERYVAGMSKAKRAGKIFVDYLRNGRGATAVAPYSARARPGAPVAMPLAWSRLEALESPAAFTVRSLLGARTLGADPWRAFDSGRASLPVARGVRTAGAGGRRG